jgi:hypothetical protein
MTDDRDSRINLLDDASIAHWTSRFGVSRDELEEAVDTVGDNVAAVTAYLNVEDPQDRG